MVEHVLTLAETWPHWDGQPMEVPVEGEQPRVYTPHKAIRRVCDHLIDHLAEIDARLAGRPTEPDTWHGSLITTPGDLAQFAAEDLNEARNRLRRLALMWEVRLRALPAKRLDASDDQGWTLRELSHHVAESAFYADSVGALCDRGSQDRGGD